MPPAENRKPVWIYQTVFTSPSDRNFIMGNVLALELEPDDAVDGDPLDLNGEEVSVKIQKAYLGATTSRRPVQN